MASGGEDKEYLNRENVTKRHISRQHVRDSRIGDMTSAKLLEEETPPKMSWDYENYYFNGEETRDGSFTDMRLPRDKRSQWTANGLRTPGIRQTPRDMRPDGCRTPPVAGIGLRQTPEVKVYPPSNTNERVHAVEKKSIHMLQNDLAATLEEVIRLQEEVMKMTSAQNSEKQIEKRIQDKSDIPDAGGRRQPCTEGVKHTEEFRRPRITPSTFDGLTPWMDFKVHFEYCTELNEWNEKQKCLFLAVSLRGAAQQVLSNLSAEKKTDYNELVSALEKRFAPPNIEELYKSELRIRQRKPGESLLELGQAIRRLVTLAYPKAPEEVLDTLSKDSFLNSLTESEVRLKLLRARPVSFDETLQIAVELDACMKAEEKRTGKWSKVIREVDTETFRKQDDGRDAEIRELKTEIQQLKQLMQAQTQWKGRGNHSRGSRQTTRDDIICFNCNQKGHISRKCPQRVASEKTNDGSQPKKNDEECTRPTRQVRSGCLTSIDSGLYIPTIVNGKDASFIVDSGASVTIVSYETYDAMPSTNQPILRPAYLGLTLADGKTLETKGSAVFEFRVGRKLIKHEAVVAAIRGPGILGLDFMVEHECTLNLKTMTLSFEDEIVGVLLEQNMHCCRVSIQETSVIPGRSERIIFGQVLPLECKRPLPLYGIVEPCQNFSQKTKSMMCRSIVSTDHSNSVPLRLMNLHEDPLVIYKGTIAGIFEPIRTTIPADSGESTENTNLPDHIQTLLDNTDGLSPEQRKQASSFLLKHVNLFAEKGADQGHTNLIKHKIDTGDAKPIRQQPRRVPFHLKKEIDTQIDNMLSNNIIRPSSSPWASPIVLVRKKDGSLRFCIDFRKLNNVTVKDAYPLPRIDESLDALGGSRWFSTLDMMSGYWQIEVDESDKQKTAFTSHKGLFEFNVMPFGLCNAAGTFERLMQTVCAGLRWDICLIYLDDIIVFSSTFEQHLERLESVFNRLQNAGLRLRSKKCSLFKHRVSYLGHVITENGVETDPQKVKCIRSWPTPTNVSDLRSFLGLCSYYRRFVKGFAAIANPLHSLTQKDKKFDWSADCETAFQDLKRLLVTSPVLALPDFSKQFVLDTDASGSGIGAVLSQIKDGAEHVISYGSRSLTKAERRYSITRKELLAVVHFIKTYRPYLYGRRFVLRTDHSALKWMMSFKEPEGQLARWLDTLSEYDFEIRHRAGRIHCNADALSRIDHDAGIWNKSERKPVAAITIATHSKDLQKQQSDDPEIAEVIEWLRDAHRPGWDKISTRSTSLKAYWAQFDQLSVRDNVLYRKWFTNKGKVEKEQVAVPNSMRSTIQKQCHDVPSGGHLGRHKTLTKIKQSFYWPGMDKDVRRWCASCPDCAKRKKYGKTPRAPMQVTGAGDPGERVAMDILGPVPTSNKGNKYILVIQDYFTKWAEAIPLPDMEAKTVAQAFIDNYVTKYGAPRTLHTDQGRQFESRLFKQLCDILRINKTRTTPYHPQSDGMVERMNRTLENMLSMYIDSNQKNWDENLQLVCMAYRSAEHESSGFTPNYLTFGREVVLPVELVAGLPAHQKRSTEEYINELEDTLAIAHEIARNNLSDALKRQKLRYDSRLSWKKFDIGSKVWLYTPKRAKGISPKFQKWWTGPYTVLKKFSDVTYQIGKDKDRLVVHVDRLKTCICREETSESNDKKNNSKEIHFKEDTNDPPYVSDIIIDPVAVPYTDDDAETFNVAGATDSKDQRFHRGATTRSQRQCRPPRRFEDFQLYHLSGVAETSKREPLNPNINACDCHLQTCNRMARTKNTVRKVSAMHKCPLCIEIFQSPEEVLDHVGRKHDKRVRCEYCDYTSERSADIKRHCERRHPSHADVERPKPRTEEDCTTRRRTQPMPVFNPKKDKPAATGSSRDKNNNTDSLMSVVSTDVVPPVDQHNTSVAPRCDQTARNVGCQTDAVYLCKDAAVQCNTEIASRCDVTTQCNGVIVRKRRVSETEWTEFE